MILAFLAACAQEPEVPPDVRFNELVADNDRGLKDEDGDRDDWVEIAAPDQVDFGGWSLVNEGEPDAKPMELEPGTAATDGFLLITCDDGKGGLHAPFSLDPNGGLLILVDADGVFVDEVLFPFQHTDVSWAREDDGGWTYDHEPSPGAVNDLAL